MPSASDIMALGGENLQAPLHPPSTMSNRIAPICPCARSSVWSSTLIKGASLCNRQRPLQETTADQNVELQSPSHRTKQLHLRLLGHCGRGDRRVFRIRGTGSLLWDCVRAMAEATAIKVHQHGCLNRNKEDTNRYAKVEVIVRPRAYRQLRNAEREKVFSREENTYQLSNTKWSAIKIYTSQM